MLNLIDFPATHGHVGSRRACGQTRRFEKASEGRGSGFSRRLPLPSLVPVVT